MIDINELYHEKLDVTPENILKFISDYDIFNNYIENLIINKPMQSPLREKDETPSFGVYVSRKYNDILLFKDMGTNIGGNCFVFVMHLYGLNFNNSLIKVIKDFRLEDKFKISSSSEIIGQLTTPKIIKECNKYKETVINIRARKWAEHDKGFWQNYGINLSTLKKFRVVPIDYIFLNDKIIKADIYAYAYLELKDGVVRYKIYQPYSKRLKWLSNFIEGTISGFSQLPDKGNVLIITSSLKDAMTVYEYGYFSIAPQTEGYIFKKHIIDNLKKRFKKIYTYYDNDKAGIKFATQNLNTYEFNPIFTGDERYKDPSDYHKRYGSIQGKNRIKKYT